MNKKLLCAALLAGIGCVQAANAQEFDDRWYVTGSVGYNFQDSERMTDDAPFGTIGVGKFLSPNWSIDGELRSEEHTSELQSLMRTSYAVFCLKKKTNRQTPTQ